MTDLCHGGTTAAEIRCRLHPASRVLACLVLSAGLSLPAAGEPMPLADEELAVIAARDGFSLAAHLQLNSRIQLGFDSAGEAYFFTLENVGGVVDLWSLRVDLEALPDGSGNFIRFGLPVAAGFAGFGFSGAGVQYTPEVVLPAASSLGQLRLDGAASMGGSALLWAY